MSDSIKGLFITKAIRFDPAEFQEGMTDVVDVFLSNGLMIRFFKNDDEDTVCLCEIPKDYDECELESVSDFQFVDIEPYEIPTKVEEEDSV
jgi:hypothetical protein